MSDRTPPLFHQSSVIRVPAEGGSLTSYLKNGRADYVIEDCGYETPCWVWQKTRNDKGHGTSSFSSIGIRTAYAHRAYYIVAKGPVPDDWHVHHRCENPPCVNPDHLEAKPHSKHLADHQREDSVLTWDDVRAIRATFADGAASIDVLAEWYGIGKSQVHNILINHNWHDPEFTPGRRIECAECGETFIAGRWHQRFCRPEHRFAFNRRKKLVPGGYVERRLRRAA